MRSIYHQTSWNSVSLIGQTKRFRLIGLILKEAGFPFRKDIKTNILMLLKNETNNTTKPQVPFLTLMGFLGKQIGFFYDFIIDGFFTLPRLFLICNKNTCAFHSREETKSLE
jgi:hypothetical protein